MGPANRRSCAPLPKFSYPLKCSSLSRLALKSHTADQQTQSDRLPDQAILDEIESWLKYNRDTKKERAEIAQELKGFVKGSVSSSSIMENKTNSSHEA